MGLSIVILILIELFIILYPFKDSRKSFFSIDAVSNITEKDGSNSSRVPD
jgi:hypothetical protein